MDLRRLLLKIDADVNGAILGIGKVTKGLGEAEEKLGDVDKKAKETDLVREFSKWSSAFYRLVGLFEMGGARIKQALEMASEGSKIMAAQSFFENAGRSIEDLRKATGGMIADAELMKKANLADSMGISMDTFKTLAQVAQASAFKTGQSFDYMFESIIVGTARSSRLLLDNLGIIVSVKEANENYARTQLKLQGIQNATNAQINAYVEAMDDNAKKTAFAEEVQRKAAGTLEEMQRAATSTAAKYEGLNAAISNFSDTVKTSMASANEDFAVFFTRLISAMDKTAKRWDVLTSLFAGAGVLGSFIVGETPEERLKKLENTLKGFDQQEKALATEFLQSHLEQLAEKMGTKDIGKAVLAVAEYMATGKALNDAVEQQIKQIIELNRTAGGLIQGIKKPAPSEEKQILKVGGAARAIKSDIGQEAKDLIAGFGKSTEEYLDDLMKFDKWLASLEPTFQDLARETERLSDAAEMAKISLASLYYELAKPIADAVGDALSTILSGKSLFKPLAGLADTLLEEQGGIGGTISTALSGAGMGAATAGPLGAALGAATSIIADIVDNIRPVGPILKSIVAMFQTLIGNSLTPILEMLVPLFQSLVPAVAAVGLVIRGLIDPFVDTFRPLIELLAFFFNALTIPLTLLGILANMIFAVVQVVGSLFGILSPAFAGIHEALKGFQEMVIDAAINLNNALIGLIRMLPGMAEFGNILTKEDFLGPQEDNTEAVKENTRAIRDLAREFRNVPSGYKVSRTVYEASSPEIDRRSLRSVYSNDAFDAFRNNPRWRT